MSAKACGVVEIKYSKPATPESEAMDRLLQEAGAALPEEDEQEMMEVTGEDGTVRAGDASTVCFGRGEMKLGDREECSIVADEDAMASSSSLTALSLSLCVCFHRHS